MFTGTEGLFMLAILALLANVGHRGNLDDVREKGEGAASLRWPLGLRGGVREKGEG